MRRLPLLLPLLLLPPSVRAPSPPPSPSPHRPSSPAAYLDRLRQHLTHSLRAKCSGPGGACPGLDPSHRYGRFPPVNILTASSSSSSARPSPPDAGQIADAVHTLHARMLKLLTADTTMATTTTTTATATAGTPSTPPHPSPRTTPPATHLSLCHTHGNLTAASSGVAPSPPLQAWDSPRVGARPNLVIILLDDAGYADLRANTAGPPSVHAPLRDETPRLDALARASLRLSNLCVGGGGGPEVYKFISLRGQCVGLGR